MAATASIDLTERYEDVIAKVLPLLDGLRENDIVTGADTSECLFWLATGSRNYAGLGTESNAWRLIEALGEVSLRYTERSRPLPADARAQIEALQDICNAIYGFIVVLEMARARLGDIADQVETAWSGMTDEVMRRERAAEKVARGGNGSAEEA